MIPRKSTSNRTTSADPGKRRLIRAAETAADTRAEDAGAPGGGKSAHGPFAHPFLCHPLSCKRASKDFSSRGLSSTVGVFSRTFLPRASCRHGRSVELHSPPPTYRNSSATTTRRLPSSPARFLMRAWSRTRTSAQSWTRRSTKLGSEIKMLTCCLIERRDRGRHKLLRGHR